MTMTRKELPACLREEAYFITEKSSEFVDLLFEIRAETLEKVRKSKSQISKTSPHARSGPG